METVRIAQKESLERREQLLKDLELANQMTQREIEDKYLAKLERKREIDSQVREQNRKAPKFSSNRTGKKKLQGLLLFILNVSTLKYYHLISLFEWINLFQTFWHIYQVKARRQAQEEEFKLELKMMEEGEEGEHDYEEMLRREAEKMSVRGYEAKVCNDSHQHLFLIFLNKWNTCISAAVFKSVIGFFAFRILGGDKHGHERSWAKEFAQISYVFRPNQVVFIVNSYHVIS